jgi:hypothetical protein
MKKRKLTVPRSNRDASLYIYMRRGMSRVPIRGGSAESPDEELRPAIRAKGKTHREKRGGSP